MAMEAHYNSFVIFLEAQANINKYDYVEELQYMEKIRMVNRSRTIRDIVEEVGQGKEVSTWKRTLEPSRIISQINSISRGDIVYIDQDLLVNEVYVLADFLPMFPRREEVTCWQTAQEKKVLKSYFGQADIYRLTEGESQDYDYFYGQDYDSYLRESYPQRELVKIYRGYLNHVQVEIPIRENSFDSPKYFVGPTFRQYDEYERILLAVERSDQEEFCFVGDGLGIGSLISIANEIPYYSVEKNRVGKLALGLGIIHSKILDNRRDYRNSILVLANVEEYLSDEEVDNYRSQFDKIVVIADSRVSRLGTPVIELDNKVFLLNVKMRSLTVKPIAYVYDYLKVREPVLALDEKSKIYVKSEKIEEGESGFRVSYGNREDAFNIRNRKFPGNMSYARKGDIKIYQDTKFEYEREGMLVATASEVFRYYPESPGFSSILMPEKYKMVGDLVVAMVLRPRQYTRYIDALGIISSIYYLYSKKNGDQSESYYSLKNLGISSVVIQEGYNNNG